MPACAWANPISPIGPAVFVSRKLPFRAGSLWFYVYEKRDNFVSFRVGFETFALIFLIFHPLFGKF